MKIVLFIIIAILILAITILVFIKRKLKRRLESIDGFVGISKNNIVSGKVIGGVINKEDL